MEKTKYILKALAKFLDKIRAFLALLTDDIVKNRAKHGSHWLLAVTLIWLFLIGPICVVSDILFKIWVSVSIVILFGSMAFIVSWCAWQPIKYIVLKWKQT